MEDDLEGRRGGAHGLVRCAGLGSRHRCTAINARGPVSLCTQGTSLELTGLLHTPPPTTVHLLQLFLCQLLSLLLAVLFILFHNLNALPGLGF